MLTVLKVNKSLNSDIEKFEENKLVETSLMNDIVFEDLFNETLNELFDFDISKTFKQEESTGLYFSNKNWLSSKNKDESDEESILNNKNKYQKSEIFDTINKKFQQRLSDSDLHINNENFFNDNDETKFYCSNVLTDSNVKLNDKFTKTIIKVSKEKNFIEELKNKCHEDCLESHDNKKNEFSNCDCIGIKDDDAHANFLKKINDQSLLSNECSFLSMNSLDLSIQKNDFDQSDILEFGNYDFNIFINRSNELNIDFIKKKNKDTTIDDEFKENNACAQEINNNKKKVENIKNNKNYQVDRHALSKIGLNTNTNVKLYDKQDWNFNHILNYKNQPYRPESTFQIRNDVKDFSFIDPLNNNYREQFKPNDFKKLNKDDFNFFNFDRISDSNLNRLRNSIDLQNSHLFFFQNSLPRNNNNVSNKTTSNKESKKISLLPPGVLDNFWEGPDENKMFICTYKNCRKKFTRRYNIRSHIQTHLSDRPFSCFYCFKSFVRQHDFNRHLKGHLEKKYCKCVCGKIFTRHDSLKKHIERNICVGGNNPI